MINVLIYEPGGVVRTVPTDFVTASRIVRAAKLAGKDASIIPWTRWETRHWRQLLDRQEATTIAVGIMGGTCECTLRPTGESILCLVPFGVEVLMADGNKILFQLEVPTVPQGTVSQEPPPDVAAGSDEHPYFAPPDLKHGQATEERDG